MAESLFQGFLDSVEDFLAPLIPESVLEDSARQRLKEKHPEAPVEWAINYARSNTDRATKGIGGPLRTLVRRTVLKQQLDESETYLTSMSDFLQLESPIDKEDT